MLLLLCSSLLSFFSCVSIVISSVEGDADTGKQSPSFGGLFVFFCFSVVCIVAQIKTAQVMWQLETNKTLIPLSAEYIWERRKRAVSNFLWIEKTWRKPTTPCTTSKRGMGLKRNRKARHKLKYEGKTDGLSAYVSESGEKTVVPLCAMNTYPPSKKMKRKCHAACPNMQESSCRAGFRKRRIAKMRMK